MNHAGSRRLRFPALRTLAFGPSEPSLQAIVPQRRILLFLSGFVQLKNSGSVDQNQ
jgi:hypothetical protein